LPDQVELFGPLRNYWDGNFEHGIQHIKPELKCMRKTVTYLFQKLVNIRKKVSFKIIKDQFMLNVSDDDPLLIDLDSAISAMEGEEANCKKDGERQENNSTDQGVEEEEEESIYSFQEWIDGYYRFENLKEVKDRLTAGGFLCGFLNKKEPDVVCIVVGRKRNDSVTFVKVKPSADVDNFDEVCGLAYVRLETDDVIHSNSRQKLMADTECYCLLLPFKRAGFSFVQQFAIVTSDWRCLDGNSRKIALPTLSRKLWRDWTA
jgi:hypothetical protein